jgi:hypothetical protein
VDIEGVDDTLLSDTLWSIGLVVVYYLHVYYGSITREVKTRPTYECRCDERLKTKAEEST